MVSSEHATQVSASHACLTLGDGQTPCSPVLGNLLPRDRLGSEYILTPPPQDSVTWIEQRIRVVASIQDTNIDIYPSYLSEPVYLASQGQVFDFDWIQEPVLLSADADISVAQVIRSAPGARVFAESLVPTPVAGFRRYHAIAGLPGFSRHRVTVVGPQGLTIMVEHDAMTNRYTLDNPISGTRFGYTDFAAPLSNGGVAVLTADVEFGVTLFALEGSASYWLPGSVTFGPVQE